MNSPAASPQTIAVSITGTGMYAATGDLDAALWGAIAARLFSGRPVAGLTVPATDQGMEQPYFAPIAALPEQLKSVVRIPIMAQEALSQASAFLPEDRIGLRILILTLLPASSPERPIAGNLNQEELAAALRDTHPALAMAEVRFATADTGATSHLSQVIGELQEGRWDAVLFGGADSLTDRGTILALAAKGRCRTDRHPEGILPGEGAAYLLLEKQEADRPCRALITGLGQACEENPGKAANCRMTALTNSIEQALAQAQCKPSQVETLILPMGKDVAATLEWYQVQRTLWSKPEEIHPDQEELHLQNSIGDTGAAALPLSLVIGCARFEFNFPPAERTIVCEAGRGEPRGAVFLKKLKQQTKSVSIQGARTDEK
jgi:3-oxoacyl-[acyl-carrier-protein] synthase-1